MTPADFDFVAQMLKRRSGLVIGPDKIYLLDSRLAPVARQLQLANIDAVVAKVKAGDEAVCKAVTEAMTTNETFFYRDKTPFEQFEKLILPHMLQARAKDRRLRIWSAAASTGQESYSLAMILREKAAQMRDWKIDIFGTDLSNEALAKAKAGAYSQFEVQRGLPVTHLVKYFAKQGEQWCIKDDIRAMVKFQTGNLLDPFTGFGTFDVVFCRNVLIYFDEATKRDILGRIAQLMPPDGYLLLGAAETVVGISSSFAPIDQVRGVFSKQGAPKPASIAPAARAVGA
ncbi:MAG: protein-glutamate O-methyltransferase CheR [Micropepsaceae bacterium]